MPSQKQKENEGEKSSSSSSSAWKWLEQSKEDQTKEPTETDAGKRWRGSGVELLKVAGGGQTREGSQSVENAGEHGDAQGEAVAPQEGKDTKGTEVEDEGRKYKRRKARQDGPEFEHDDRDGKGAEDEMEGKKEIDMAKEEVEENKELKMKK